MTLVEDTATLPTLSPSEIRRYSRHLIMPEVGTIGQQKLKAAKVLMIGTGGLGSPLGMYLAAADPRLGPIEFLAGRGQPFFVHVFACLIEDRYVSRLGEPACDTLCKRSLAHLRRTEDREVPFTCGIAIEVDGYGRPDHMTEQQL